MADRLPPDSLEDSLEFDPLDPHAATRLAPMGAASQEPAAPVDRSSATAVVDRRAATRVVTTVPAPAPPRPAPPPLKIDFNEVLGRSREAAGAKRIGAQALEMGDFQSKYDKQALERALAAPKFDLPNTLEDEARNQPVRVVEKRGRVWLRALLFILVPTLLAVVGAFVYSSVSSSDATEELERLKQADELHRKAAQEHEKELAR